jgi:hypothetical protein
MVEEVDRFYGGHLDGDPRSPSATPADFSAPGGTCLVGYDGDPYAAWWGEREL